MKKLLLVVMTSLAINVAMAQTANEPERTDYTLKERFGIMKAKSESYKEYRVIKETVLDGVWKIIQDTLTAKDGAIQAGKLEVTNLQNTLEDTRKALKEKEESMAETLHASTHISVLGIDISKGVFLGLVGIVFGGLLLLTLAVIGRMKLLSKSLQERKLTVNLITTEFEEYKRKAMDKQTKLSRELQDERNKLNALRNS
jgi:hypothetical protein